MDREAWSAAIHGVAKSRTRLSDCTFTFHFHVLEKEMATHSSVLAWIIPGTGEPGGLHSQSMPSRRGLTPRGSLECNPEIPAFPGFPGPETVVSDTDSIGSLGRSAGLQGCCSGAKGELSPAVAAVPLFPYRNLPRGGTGRVV